MRLAVTKCGHYEADVYCSNAREARRILREKSVSMLAIDFQLAGKDTGNEILRWANEHDVLPNYVVIVARDRAQRISLANSLEQIGFRSADKTTYFRH